MHVVPCFNIILAAITHVDHKLVQIARMEMQSLSIDLIESTQYSLIVTKLINVALALLAVIFVLVSAIAGVVQPLYATRFVF